MIDGEHAALLRYLEYLRKSQHELRSSDFVSEVINNIGQVLLDHLDHEEEIMKRSKMPHRSRNLTHLCSK